MERGGSGKQIGNWKGERGEEGREKTRRREQREEGECVKKNVHKKPYFTYVICFTINNFRPNTFLKCAVIFACI